MIDAFTAVVLLHHDLDIEETVLTRALASPAFYIGALGSTRTHRRRLERLRSSGTPSESFDRIKAPIGLFGPTRDSTSLALSVLADVAAARLETFA
jgi:xanthine dehydrogenase accessory factor